MPEITVVLMFAGIALLVIGCWLMVRGFNDEDEEPERLVVFKESEIRRILIWHYAASYENATDEEDDKLAENLRKIYDLSPDVQEYPEWD